MRRRRYAPVLTLLAFAALFGALFLLGDADAAPAPPNIAPQGLVPVEPTPGAGDIVISEPEWRQRRLY
jgi:hypothetical protein